MFMQGKYDVDGMNSFVESYDFSKANMNQANRLHAVTLVASICYNNPKAIGSISLFNRLACEASSLPSSAYEFVPVLLDPRREPDKMILGNVKSNVRKYGEWVTAEDELGKTRDFLLTNYRALVFDYEVRSSALIAVGASEESIEELKVSYLELYNNPHECEIIKQHFKVFKFKVDLSTRSQMVRHRVNWQELSRRYVSGKRVPFDFYISEKMKDVTTEYGNTQKILDICLEHYYKALEDGVKPQEARRIIPQAMYTDIWGAFQPKQLENFYNLRLDDAHAQREINLIAKAMKGFE